jgi:riboflavin synthase
MFTGLVQSLAKVESLVPDGFGGFTLVVTEPKMAPTLELGESISINGVCLTVVNFDATTARFQVGPETVQRTVLGRLHTGAVVNLERSLRVGDRLGGHFVSGHVDCVSTIYSREPNGEWETIWFNVSEEYQDLLIQKGSIAIDGISLTVVEVLPTRFSVMLIPHTLAHTTLGTKQPGTGVNLEFDQLAKYVKKMLDNMTITV